MSLKIRYNNHSVTFCGANVDAPSLTIQSSIGIQAYLRRFEILKDFNDGYKVAVTINRGTYWAAGFIHDTDRVTVKGVKGAIVTINGIWDRISKYIRDYTDRICKAISDRRTINAARPVERKVNYNFLDTDTARYTARIQNMDNCDYGSHPADVAHVHGSKLGGSKIDPFAYKKYGGKSTIEETKKPNPDVKIDNVAKPHDKRHRGYVAKHVSTATMLLWMKSE